MPWSNAHDGTRVAFGLPAGWVRPLDLPPPPLLFPVHHDSWCAHVEFEGLLMRGTSMYVSFLTRALFMSSLDWLAQGAVGTRAQGMSMSKYSC